MLLTLGLQQIKEDVETRKAKNDGKLKAIVNAITTLIADGQSFRVNLMSDIVRKERVRAQDKEDMKDHLGNTTK